MPRSKGASFTSRGSRAVRGSRGGSRGRGIHVTGPHRVFLDKNDPHTLKTAAFTLADEARQTSQHDHSSWGQDSSLRGKPVTFISAGKKDPLMDFNKLPPQGLPEEVHDMPLLEQNHRDAARATNDHLPDIAGLGDSEAIGRKEVDEDINEAFQGSEELGVQINPSFFFDVTGQKGNEDLPKAPVKVPERNLSPGDRSPDVSSSDEIILFRGRNNKPRAHCSAAISNEKGRTEVQVDQQQTPEISAKPSHRTESPGIHLTIRSRPSGRGRRNRRRGQGNASDDDSMLADYIANMRANGEIQETSRQHMCNRRDLGGTESDTSEHSPEPNKIMRHGGLRMRSGRNAGTGYEAACKAVAPSSDDSDAKSCGTQNEFVNDNLSRSNAAPNPRLGSDAALEEVISSDFDASSDEVETGLDLTSCQDTFDLMDWERPSLRRKKGKGSRAPLTVSGCDPEMEQLLQAAWKSDRLKKKQRKKQREELRALGLLGQKTKADDLRVKYPTGMTIQEVAAEVREFLTRGDEILSFPPMDLHARKTIHDLASKFNIKSKSTGKADQRRPTLYRTGRTLPYIESTFEQAVARIRRPYLPRMDVKKKKGPAQTPATRGSYAAASYRDGEIVGAAAPELGTDNRGRTMLEKMGWSSGTALGATNNKGILQPVTHAMKRSKAGLG